MLNSGLLLLVEVVVEVFVEGKDQSDSALMLEIPFREVRSVV